MNADEYILLTRLGEGKLELAGCKRCGATVWDTIKHDEFHKFGGVRAAFGSI